MNIRFSIVKKKTSFRRESNRAIIQRGTDAPTNWLLIHWKWRVIQAEQIKHNSIIFFNHERS